MLEISGLTPEPRSVQSAEVATGTSAEQIVSVLTDPGTPPPGFTVETDDITQMLDALPADFAAQARKLDSELILEIIMDLGRIPTARLRKEEIDLATREVTAADIKSVVDKLGSFATDNRAGIERTLHRISALRNRQGTIIGLTLRVGRAILGTTEIIRDVVESSQSILLLGPPGVGKTTMLREIARVLADESHLRVVVVDTSNEIGGDGDVPHKGIGRARRMQVSSPAQQHATMIEAVENHMPQVVVIDEIGTFAEASAARTIAERGVRLIATAHGQTLSNLLLNPTLSDLVGGVQSVILSDESAKNRGTQKSVLERKRPPTFNTVVEIHDYAEVTVYSNVSETIDAILQGDELAFERRSNKQHEKVSHSASDTEDMAGYYPRKSGRKKANGLESAHGTRPSHNGVRQNGVHANVVQVAAVVRPPLRLYCYGVSLTRLQEAAQDLEVNIVVVSKPEEADIALTSKHYYRRKSSPLRNAQTAGLPVYVARGSSYSQVLGALQSACEQEGWEISEPS